MVGNIDRLTAAERATWRRWFGDGLADIGTGVLLLGLTAIHVFLEGYPLLGTAYVVVGAWLMRRLVAAAKARLVDPRIGHLRFPKRSGWSVPVSLGVGLATIATMMFLVLLPRDAANQAPGAWYALDPLVVGVVAFASGIFAFLCWNTRLWRYALMAVAAPVTAIAAHRAGLDESQNLHAIAAVVGVLSLAGGTVALRVFVRNYPQPSGR